MSGITMFSGATPPVNRKRGRDEAEETAASSSSSAGAKRQKVCDAVTDTLLSIQNTSLPYEIAKMIRDYTRISPHEVPRFVLDCMCLPFIADLNQKADMQAVAQDALADATTVDLSGVSLVVYDKLRYDRENTACTSAGECPYSNRLERLVGLALRSFCPNLTDFIEPHTSVLTYNPSTMWPQFKGLNLLTLQSLLSPGVKLHSKPPKNETDDADTSPVSTASSSSSSAQIEPELECTINLNDGVLEYTQRCDRSTIFSTQIRWPEEGLPAIPAPKDS